MTNKEFKLYFYGFDRIDTLKEELNKDKRNHGNIAKIRNPINSDLPKKKKNILFIVNSIQAYIHKALVYKKNRKHCFMFFHVL